MKDPRSKLTHLDPQGMPRMVDVSQKEDTHRRAVAEGAIRMAPETLQAIRDGKTPKGDVLQIAQIAGIQGGKRSGELIPLCHMLPGASLVVELEADSELQGAVVLVEARIRGQTGVEMEALTAASVALLTVYDMAKSMDRGMVLEGIRLVTKEGGKSGRWSLEDQE